jgi:hypothetical protein
MPVKDISEKQETGVSSAPDVLVIKTRKRNPVKVVFKCYENEEEDGTDYREVDMDCTEDNENEEEDGTDYREVDMDCTEDNQNEEEDGTDYREVDMDCTEDIQNEERNIAFVNPYDITVLTFTNPNPYNYYSFIYSSNPTNIYTHSSLPVTRPSPPVTRPSPPVTRPRPPVTRRLSNLRLCNSYLSNTRCRFEARCKFAHSKEHLTRCRWGNSCSNIRVSSSMYYSNKHGRYCNYIHEDESFDNYVQRMKNCQR